jgi:hypothetical protein
MFRPRQAIIRWFLRKYTNDDWLHTNSSASIKHFCQLKLGWIQ